MPAMPIIALIVLAVATVGLFVRRSHIRALEPQVPAQEQEAPGMYGSSDSNAQSKAERRRTKKLITRIGWGVVALYVLGICLAAGSFVTRVSTKNVGVVTSFGKPVGSLDNGIHLKAPWQEVTELDGAIQTDTHAGTGQKDDTPCTSVRIAHQSVACVDNSIRWRIQPGAADRLFRDYKDFSNIRDSLVTRELSSALNTVFKDYDPLATDEKGNTISPSQDTLSKSVTSLLKAEIGEDIDVKSVFVPIVHFDDQTQGRINALQAEVANTRIAKQRQQTADAEAEANRKLANSVSKDPNVLVSKCFDTLAEMVKAKREVPAGFSCWPSSQSALVVPSAK